MASSARPSIEWRWHDACVGLHRPSRRGSSPITPGAWPAWRWTTHPNDFARGLGVTRSPLRLARLGVAVEHEGQGLGAGLLQDVIARTHALSSEIGCRGLVVHAEPPEAKTFYEYLVPEFEASPTDPPHLFLLMKDIRRTLT